MLSITRTAGTTIVLKTSEGPVTIVVDRRVRVGIEAPREVTILRGELVEAKGVAA